MGILETYGYKVYEITDDIIYNEYMFEEWMRRFFGLPEGFAGSGGSHGSHESDPTDDPMWTEILTHANNLELTLQLSINGMIAVIGESPWQL